MNDHVTNNINTATTGQVVTYYPLAGPDLVVLKLLACVLVVLVAWFFWSLMARSNVALRLTRFSLPCFAAAFVSRELYQAAVILSAWISGRGWAL